MKSAENTVLAGAVAAGRALVPFPAAQRTLCVSRRLLKKILAKNGMPIIELSPRKQAVMLAHLDMLIALNARPASAAGAFDRSRYGEAVYG